jgi:hypothetical protein
MQAKKVMSGAVALLSTVVFSGNAFARIAGVATVDAISTQPARLAPIVVSDVEPEELGPYQGFDTSTYPGDDVMRAWRASGAYDWVGYYLPAPCHKDESWSGTRGMLEEMGWGTAVIYVGQQTWGRTPRRRATLGRPSTCAADLVGAGRGRMDGDDAIARTEAEGFPRGTTIFLDIEYMGAVPPRMREYYRAWTARLLEDGRYWPAYYTHTRNAATIYADVAAVFAHAGVSMTPLFWIAGGSDFSRDKDPADVGHAFAVIWQGMLDIVEHQGGVALPIDVSVGAFPSPSQAITVE